MVRNAGTCLYKEARLNIEPAFPGSTISITLPAKSANAIGFSTRPKRTIYDEKDTGIDDDAFTKRHLANDGSVYFRRRHTYPRSFLWRMLDERKTLEIQAVDLENDERSTHEANLTLLLHFSSPIRPFCVAFADPDDKSSISVFAITTTNELYSLSIPCAFFSRESASEVEIDYWCKRSSPALLHANTPYRLVAVGINELLVSLDSGSILRLVRENKDDTIWTEATFQHSNWSLTLRGVLPWKGQQTVRFGTTDLVASTAANMSLSPDGDHIICVCLDHTLRMFNLQSGKMTRQQDLINVEDDAQDRNQSHLLGPSQPRLMQIVEVTGVANVSYFVIVYSPIQHEFKFYGVPSSDAAAPEAFVDIQPDFSLVPPIDDLMNATVWNLEEFFVVPSGSGWKGTALWLRARSGPSSRVFSIIFDPSDDSERLPRVWKNDWTTVDSGPLTIEGLRKEPKNPGEQDWDASELYEIDITERWLDFLFIPGRFTIPTLETALFILRKGLDSDRRSARLKGSLKDRLCTTIAEAAQKHAPEVSTENYEQLIAEQWDAYYGLVKDLHKRRGESLSLAYDPVSDQPWLVLSDCLSAIRKCSEPEAILNNSDILTIRHQHPTGPLRKTLQKPEAQSLEVRRLLNAAASFRRRLPPSFQQDLKRHLHADLLQSRSITVIDRMEQMEADCDLTSVVTEDDLASLIEDLGNGNGISHLSTEVFQSALRALKFERKGGQPRSTQTARYGLKALLRIAQETLDFNYESLLDLLVLILFMQFEEDISDDFDASVIFFDLINEFKDWLVLDWIATTVWSHQTPTGRSSTRWMKEFDDASKTSSRFPITQTALEGMFGYGATSIPMPSNLKTGFLTYWGQGWLASIFSAQGQTFDSVVEDMMGKLLFQKEYHLAKDFSKFLPESSWASYLKGRMHITLGENELASPCFQKPAYNLALGIGFSVDMADTARLVPETEQDLFSDGLPKYYNHVLGLFEKAKAYSFAADYARLGLTSMIGFEDEVLRTELLQRLFTASIQTSRFEEAYTAMTRHSDSALKLSSLKSLVTSMVAQAQTAALLKFPLVGIVEEMDTILSDLCQKTLNIGSGPPYHQILYSFRVSRGNFRGAATILYERLQRLKSTSSKVHDPADESLIQCYLMIINALSSVSPQDAYILADQRIDEGMPQFLHGPIGTAKKLLKRHIVTLDTLRKEYQEELDRVAAIENGHFAFMDPADEMDIL